MYTVKNNFFKITHRTYTGVLTLCAPSRFFWEVDLRPKIEMLRIELDPWTNSKALNMIFLQRRSKSQKKRLVGINSQTGTDPMRTQSLFLRGRSKP